MMNNKKLVLIALSFGAGKNHGQSNYYIAKNLAEQMFVHQCAGIAQWEVHDLVKKHFSDRIEELPLFSIQADDKYFDSFAVLQKADDIVTKEEFNSISYIGHHAHLWRVRRVALKFGMPQNHDLELKWFVPYDEESTQWWTRSWWQFWPREILVIIVWSLVGRM